MVLTSLNQKKKKKPCPKMYVNMKIIFRETQITMLICIN